MAAKERKEHHSKVTGIPEKYADPLTH